MHLWMCVWIRKMKFHTTFVPFLEEKTEPFLTSFWKYSCPQVKVQLGDPAKTKNVLNPLGVQLQEGRMLIVKFGNISPVSGELSVCWGVREEDESMIHFQSWFHLFAVWKSSKNDGSASRSLFIRWRKGVGRDHQSLVVQLPWYGVCGERVYLRTELLN